LKHYKLGIDLGLPNNFQKRHFHLIMNYWLTSNNEYLTQITTDLNVPLDKQTLHPFGGNIQKKEIG